MSWRRGFIRIWVVVSVVWAAVMAYLAYDAYQNPSRRTEIMAQIPVICADARGTAGIDYSYDRDRGLIRSDRYQGREWHDACWYSVDDYVRLYQPDPSASISEIRRAGYASTISIDAEPPTFQSGERILGQWALAAFLPPLGLLLVGAIVGWMASGFRRPTSST